MTPERKEVIKEDAQYEVNAGYGYFSSDIRNREALELLAVLEEVEQQNELYKRNIESAMEQHRKDRISLREAQQTIARQREALESIYEESEDQGARACAAMALGIEVEGNQ